MTVEELGDDGLLRRALRPIMMIGVALVLLVGLSISGGSTAQAQSEEPAQDGTQDPNAEPNPDGEAPEEPTSGSGDHGAKSIFITMEPLVAPVLDERNIKGNITVVLKLFIRNPENEEKIRLRMPKLNDAYLNYLYRYGSSAASSGVMQLDAILRAMQRQTDKILGKGEVQVLLHEVSRSRSK